MGVALLSFSQLQGMFGVQSQKFGRTVVDIIIPAAQIEIEDADGDHFGYLPVRFTQFQGVNDYPGGSEQEAVEACLERSRKIIAFVLILHFNN
jgi:hypothetical protein